MQTIDKQIDQIMFKISVSYGYSELSQDKLRASIRDYLLESHDADMEALSVQMEIEQMSGIKIDSEWYKTEYTKIKNRLNDRILELAYMGEDKGVLKS